MEVNPLHNLLAAFIMVLIFILAIAGIMIYGGRKPPKCGWNHKLMAATIGHYNYCPNCGLRIRE